MSKKPVKGHHGHAYCGGLCVPHFLNEQFSEQLGPHVNDFDLLAWYPKRDAQRRLEQIVVSEPLTWWRDAFQAEIAFRGWVKPKYRPVPQAPPVQAAQLQKIATFGRSKEENERHMRDYIEAQRKRAGLDVPEDWRDGKARQVGSE